MEHCYQCTNSKLPFFKSKSNVYEYNKLEYNSNDVLASDSTRLDNTKLSIKRVDGTTTIETKQKD